METKSKPATDTWRTKANRVIGELCLASYRKANTKPNGEYYKVYRPYIVPEDAEFLVECLRADDEIAAKAYFVHGVKSF